MPEQFNYQSTIRSIQSRLISQSIRDAANLDFLRSEEALTEVIKSYQDRFRASKGMLFDASQYVVKSADIIRVEDFNEMFESLFIDLSALYNDLDLVSQIMKLNLGRNKNYFLVVKKRIRDLWNKLNLMRLLVYDENPSDESYYESFFTKINAKKLKEAVVDKKSGFLYLAPEFKRVHNISPIVKSVTSTTYPEHNDNGGVRFTTSELNTFEDNYENGPRDMLENGLWKDQVLCNEIPDINLDIGSNNPARNRSYKGIVSIVDIEFVYPVEINRLDFDVFGDLVTKIDAVLYKITESEAWSVANIKNPNRIPIEDDYTAKTKTVRGEAFDVISFQNIDTVRAKHLRVVFNQENYVFLDSKDISQKSVDEKIQTDLSERRYELIKFGADLDDILSKPVNDENTSLYYRILDIIESTNNIEVMLDEIDSIINPKVNVVAYSYERTAKFEIGAWSIEPKLEKYTQAVGVFDSMNYTIPDRPLTSVAITTKQTEPKSTTANWFVGIGSKNVPIIENNKIIRKEPLYPVDMRAYSIFSDWTAGAFFLLDFPVDTILYEYMYISVNGGEFKSLFDYENVAFLNSRLIYIHNITDPFKAVYTIKYPAALRSSVNLYALKAKPGIDAPEDVTLDIVSSRYEVLKAFIQEEHWTSLTEVSDDNELLTLGDMFDVTSVTSTLDEAKLWFGEDFTTALFIGTKASEYFNLDLNKSAYKKLISSGDTKTKSTYADVLAYLGGSSLGYSDFTLLGNIANVAPLSQTRTI